MIWCSSVCQYWPLLFKLPFMMNGDILKPVTLDLSPCFIRAVHRQFLFRCSRPSYILAFTCQRCRSWTMSFMKVIGYLLRRRSFQRFFFEVVAACFVLAGCGVLSRWTFLWEIWCDWEWAGLAGCFTCRVFHNRKEKTTEWQSGSWQPEVNSSRKRCNHSGQKQSRWPKNFICRSISTA